MADLVVLADSVRMELRTATGARREELLDVLPEVQYQLQQKRELLASMPTWKRRRG